VPAEAFAERPKELVLTAYYAYCTSGLSSVCVPAKASWKVGVNFTEAGSDRIELKN